MTVSTAPKPQPRKTYFTDDDRAALADGYRHLADLIEAGQCPIPTGPAITIFTDDPAEAVELRHALGGGRYAKDEYDGYGTASLILKGMCGGLPVDLWITRSQVCERVQVGTRKVAEELPVGEDTRPWETVTRVEPVYEWKCAPVLDAAVQAAGGAS